MLHSVGNTEEMFCESKIRINLAEKIRVVVSLIIGEAMGGRIFHPLMTRNLVLL